MNIDLRKFKKSTYTYIYIYTYDIYIYIYIYVYRYRSGFLDPFFNHGFVQGLFAKALGGKSCSKFKTDRAWQLPWDISALPRNGTSKKRRLGPWTTLQLLHISSGFCRRHPTRRKGAAGGNPRITRALFLAMASNVQTNRYLDAFIICVSMCMYMHMYMYVYVIVIVIAIVIVVAIYYMLYLTSYLTFYMLYVYICICVWFCICMGTCLFVFV